MENTISLFNFGILRGIFRERALREMKQNLKRQHECQNCMCHRNLVRNSKSTLFEL